MIKKYFFPFLVSFMGFISFGFLPSDCVSESPLNHCFTKEGLDYERCTYKGFPLYGTVQFVESFPDIKIQIVENFPDLKVKMVTNFPDNCGEWQVVNHFPDIKVQLVEKFPDIKVKFVDHFPGKP